MALMEPQQPSPSNDSGLLTTEQQFALHRYRQEVKLLSRQELEEMFIEVVRQGMGQKNLFKDLVGKEPSTEIPGLSGMG